MNKNDYLKRLSRLLHMLKEDEVRDIIGEYEQHIDMKMAEGMSEEEAVAAFGTVEELAAEILDAYHVKPDFKEKKTMEVFEKVQTESKKAMKNASEAGKGFWVNLRKRESDFVCKCKNGIKKAVDSCKKVILAPFVFFKGFFKKKESFENLSAERTVKTKKENRLGKAILRLFKGILRLIKKIYYGFLLLLFGSIGLILILCFGFLLVLLILGYPIVGLTLIVLGTAMSVNAVAYYAGYKWRRI